SNTPLPILSFFFSVPHRPPISTLFPYTTLFRSLERPFCGKLARLVRVKSRHTQRERMASASPPESGPSVPAFMSARPTSARSPRSEEHTSELQSLAYLVCRLLLEKKKKIYYRFT